LSPCPTILTLHDAIDFTYYAAHKKRDLRSILSTFMHWYSRKSADTIITVSHHAKKDLIQYLSIPENKIRVTYEGAEDHFKKIERNTELFLDFEKRFGLNKPFFFYLGGFDKRKNVPFLIDTILKMNRDDFQLVLAGGKKEELPDTLCEKLNHQILFADWLEDSEVIALYNEAQAFIYPSFYEGFGLQVCEAMSCHCPVITSNRSSLPEVIDNPDALFSPDDSTKLQTLITNILDDKDFRKKLKDHSIERIKSFSWKKLAKQSLDIYQQVLK
jgi:glycosyltransferase involved in cell wall biosynthesis